MVTLLMGVDLCIMNHFVKTGEVTYVGEMLDADLVRGYNIYLWEKVEVWKE